MAEYNDIEVQLTGEDGNGFLIVARVSKALRYGGVSAEKINEYRAEAMSSDYDHLLQTTINTVKTF